MKSISALFVLTSALFLGACSSGSDDSVSLGGKIIDGYIQGATVCVDENNNGACDSGEPSTTSSADGSYSLSYSGSIIGKHILAIVPIGAIDSDLGPVTAEYNLLAPAEYPTTVTPMSTMVSHEMIDKGATANEAAQSIKTEFNFSQDPLNYDFKSKGDNDTLNLAQSIAASIAQANASLKKENAASDLSAHQIMKAAIKETKENILPAIIKADGTIDKPSCGSTCKQTDFTKHIEGKASAELSSITSRIQTIVSETKSGNGTVVSFKDVFTQGLSVVGFNSGRYKKSDGTIANYADKISAEYYTYTADKLVQVANILDAGQWFEEYDPPTDFVTLWDGSQWVEFIDESDLGGTPVVEGNCVTLIKPATKVKMQKVCLASKDLSGKKLNDIFPNICKDDGKPISGCNPEILLPTGSAGYEMGFQTLVSMYEFQIGSWGRYATSLSDFTSNINSANPSTIGDNCSVGFYIVPNGSSSGTIRWTKNQNPCNSGFNNGPSFNFETESESTAYAIKSVGGKNVMVADVPNIYRRLNPGDMQMGCKFAFAVVKNNTTPQVQGVHKGEYCDANTRFKVPFTGNIDNSQQFMSSTLFKFLLSQRGMASYPGI
jgi:hypothetical protein